MGWIFWWMIFGMLQQCRYMNFILRKIIRGTNIEAKHGVDDGTIMHASRGSTKHPLIIRFWICKVIWSGKCRYALSTSCNIPKLFLSVYFFRPNHAKLVPLSINLDTRMTFSEYNLKLITRNDVLFFVHMVCLIFMSFRIFLRNSKNNLRISLITE